MSTDITNVGTIPTQISNLGTDAVATFQAGLSSLSSGAVGFAPAALASIQSATGTVTT